MITFNRLARLEEFDPAGLLVDQHPLVTEETLSGQHPIRAWEYSQALHALVTWGYRHLADRQRAGEVSPSPSWLFADIGGAGSNFWKTLTRYSAKPIYRIDPNHDWQDPDHASLLFRQTLGQFLQAREAEGTPPFDAVFAISVLEHVPSAELQQFERDLVSLVKPGGLLVLTCDVGPRHPDVYHFHWMRARIYTPAGLAAWHVVAAGSYGLRSLTPPDYAWHGPTVYDYTIGSLVFVKEP